MIDVILKALSFYGESESRQGDSTTIVGWLKRTLISRKSQSKDETSWCAAFASSMLIDAGYAIKPLARAASFLDQGTEVKLDDATMGNVVVLSSSVGSGHVGFFIRRVGNVVFVLGGNQKNRVGIDPYPIDRILKIRAIPKT